MSDTANDLNIDLITSSCISQEASGSALNDSIAANIDNIDAIASKLGGNYELADKVQDAVYANLADYGNKSLALENRGALEATKDFAVNTLGKGLIGGTLSGIGGALGMASAATGSDMLAGSAAAVSGLGNLAKEGSNALLSKAQTDYDSISHRKTDSSYNYNKVKRDTKIANGGDPTIAGLGNFLDDVMTAGSHLDMNDLTGATAEGLGNLLGMAATGGVGAVAKGGVMAAAKLGAAKLGATAALEAAQSSKAARILGKVFDAPTRANMMFEAGGGVDNAVEAINSYSDEQLSELSPEFNSLVEQYLQNGASPEEASQQARLDLRNQLIRTNALETGLTGAAIGRLVPGTERGLKSLGGKGLGAGSVAGYVGKAASEGIEEFGQEGSSTLIGNINEKALLNKDKDIVEGVGQSAVMGAVGGIGTSAVANARPGSMLKGIYDKGKEAIGKFSGKDGKAGEAKAETSAENERASTTAKTTSSNLQSNLESNEADNAINNNAVISTEVDKNGNSEDRDYDKALHEKAALDRASADEAKKAYEELEAKSNKDPSSVTDDELADAREKAQTLEQAAQISEQEQNHITLSDDMKQALNSNILQDEDADTRTKNIDNMTAVSAAVQVAKELNALDENSFGGNTAAYEDRLNTLGGILTALENQCKSDIDVHSEEVNGKSEVKLNKKNYVKHTINNLFNHGDTVLDAKARVQGHKFDNNKIDTTDISNILSWKNRDESLDINDETKDEARKLKDVLLNIEGLLSSDANLNTDLSINKDGKPEIDKDKTPRLDRAEKILNEFQKGINNKTLKDTKGLSKKIAYMREILHVNREIRKAVTNLTDNNSSKIAESVYREKLTNLKSTIGYTVKSGKDKNGKDLKTEYRSALPSALTHSRRMMTSLLSSENTELYSVYDSQFREYALGQWEKLGDLLDLLDKYYKAEKNHKKQNPNAKFEGVTGKSGANDSFSITPETIDQVRQLANILAQECSLTNLIYNSTQLVAKGKSNKLKQTLNVDDSLLYAPDLSHLSGNLSSMSDVTFLSNMAKKYKHISQNRVFNNRTAKMFKRVNAVTKRLNRDMAKADTTIDSNVQAAQENIAKNKAIYTEKLKEIKDNITDDDSLGKYKEAVISYVTTTGEAIPKSLILKSDNNTNPKLKPEIESLSKELNNNVYNSLVQDVTPEVVDELNEDEFDLGLTDETPEDNTGSDTFFGIDSNEAKDFFEKEFDLGETEDFDLSDIEDLSEGEVESYSLPSVVESLSRTFGEEKPSVRSNGKMPSPPDRSVVAEPDRRHDIANAAEATINGLFTRDIRSMSSREKEMILDRARKLGIPLPRVIAKKETQNSSNLHVLSNLKVKATSALHNLWRNFSSPKALRDGSAFFIKKTRKANNTSSELRDVLNDVVDKAVADGRITEFDKQNYTACSDAIISRAITLKDNILNSCQNKLAEFIEKREGVNPRIIIAELCRDKALKPLAALCDLDASGRLILDENKIEMLAVASALSLAICATKVNEDPFSTNDLWEHVPPKVKEEQRIKYQNTVNPNDFDAVTGMMFKTLMGISRNATSKDEDTVAVDGIASIALDAIVSGTDAPISYEGFPSVYTLIDSSHPDYNPTSPDTPRIKFTKEGLTSFTELVNNGANGYSKATTVQIESIAHSLSPHYENDLIFTGNHQNLDNDLDKALDKVFEEKWKKAEDILHTQGQKLSKEQKAECKSRFKEGWNQNTPMTHLINGLGAENLNRIFFDYDSEEDLKLLTPNLRGKLNVKRQQTVRAINEIELRRQNRISILAKKLYELDPTNKDMPSCINEATELLSKNRNEFIAECKKLGINPKVVEQHYMFGVTKSLRLQELDVAASPVMDKLVRDAETNITTPSKVDRNDKSYFYWKQALIQGLGLDLWKVNKDSSNWKQDSNPVNQLANEAIRLASECKEDGITLVQALEALKNGNVSTDDATKYTKVIKKYFNALKASDVKVEVKDDNNVIQKVSLNDIKADQPIILHVLSELPEAISGNNFESSLYIEIDGKSCGPSTRIGRFGYTMSLADFQLCDRGGWHTSFIGTHEDLQKLPAEIDKYIKSAKTEAEKEALTKYKENIVSGMKTDVYAQQAKKANEYIKDMQSHLTDGGKNNVGSKQLWEAINNVYDAIGINLNDIPRLLLKLIATPLAYGAGPLGAAVGFTHIIQDKIEETLSDFNKHLHKKLNSSTDDFSLNSKQLLTEFGHFKGIDDDQAAYEAGYKFFNSMDTFTNYRAAFSGKTWESYTVTCTKEENSASSSWFRNVMLNLNSDKPVITKSTLSSGTTNLWSAITMANLTSNHYVFINSPISMGATSVYPNSSQRSIFALTNLTACLNLLNGFYTGYAEMASRVANGGSLSKVQERDLFNSPAFVNMSKALGIPCGIDGTSTYFTGSSKRSSNLKGVKGIDELLKTTINGIPYTIKPSMYQWTPLGVACQPGITQGSGDADIIMRLTRQIGDKTFGAMFDGINCFLKDINDLANIIDEAQVKTNHQNLTAQLHVAFNKMGEFINKHTDLLMYNQNDISSNIMRAMASSLINMAEVYLEEVNKSNENDAESILSIITEKDANTLKSLYADLGKLKSDIATGDAGSLLNKAYDNTQQVLEIVTKAHFAKTFALTGIPDANGQRELAQNPLFTEYDVEPDTGLPMSYLNFDTMSFSTEAGKIKASTNKLGFDADGKFEYVGDDTRKHFYYNPDTQELSYVLPSNKPVGAEEIKTVHEYNARVTDVAKHKLFLKTAREIYEQNSVLPKVKTVSLTTLSLTKAAATPSAFNYTDASSDTLFENTQNSSNINSVLMELSQGIENGMRYRFDDKDKEAYRELKNKLLDRLFNLGLFNYSGKPTKDIQLHEIFAGVDFIDIGAIDDATLKGYGLSDKDINDIRTNKTIDGFSFDNKIFLPAHTVKDLKDTMEALKRGVSGYTIEKALTLIDTITHEYQHVFLGKSLKEVYFSKADDVKKLTGYAQELYKAKREAADKIEYIGKTLSKTYANMCIAYYNYLRYIGIKDTGNASQSPQELKSYADKVDLLNRYVNFIADTATTNKSKSKNKKPTASLTPDDVKKLHSIFIEVAQAVKSNKSTTENAINNKKYNPQTDGFVYDLDRILKDTLYKDTNSSEELFSIKYELERGVIGLAQISKAALNASTGSPSSENNYILAQETIVWGNNSTFLSNLAGNTSLLARLSRTGFASEYNIGTVKHETTTDIDTRVSEEAKAITSNLTIRGRSAMWTFLNSFVNTGTRAAKALRDVIYNFINNVMGLRIKKVTAKNGKKTQRKQIAFPNGTKKVELSARDILGNSFAFFNDRTLVYEKQTGEDVGLHIENASSSGNINTSQKKIFETIKNYGDKLNNSNKNVDVTLRKAFVDASVTVDRACKACKNAGFLQTTKELNAFKATFTALTFNMGFNTEEGNNLTRLLQKVIKDITPEDFDPTYNPALNQGAYNVSAEAVKKYQFIIQGFNNSNYQYVNPKVAIAMLLTDEALQEKFKNTTLTRESVAKTKNFDSSIEKAIFTALGSVTDSVDRMMSKYPDKISGDVVLASWYEAASNAALDLNSEEYQAGLFTSVLNKADELTSKAVAKLVRKGAGALSKSKIPVLSAVGTYVKEASTYVGNPALGELDTLQGAVKATTVDLNDFIRTTPENALGYLFNNKVTGWLMAPISGLFREFANQSRGDTNYYIQKKKSRNTTQQLPQHAREQTTKIVKNSVTSIKSSAEWQSATDLFIKSGLYNNTDTASSNYISKEDIEKYLINDDALNSDIRNINAGAQSRQLVQALVRYTYEGKIATNIQKRFRPNTYSISKATGDDLKAIQKLYTLESIRYIKDSNPESGKRLYSILKKDSSGKDFNYLTSITRFRFNKDLEKIKKYSSKVNGSHVDPMLNYFEGSIRDLPRSMNHIVAIKDSNDLAKYNQLGYTKINTTSSNGIIYMESPYSMENSFLSGAFSYSLNTGMGINLESCRPINAVGTDDGNALNITSGTEEEPVIPLYNADGTVALGGSVLPNKTIMDRVQKDTNLANLLGEWSGRYLTEEQAANCNRNMLIELKNLKDNASPLDSNNFINILNPKETASLPQHTKKALSMVTANKQLLLDAKEVFGDENTLYVRKDMLNDVLGMQRASIIDVLNGNTELPKFFTDLTKVIATIAGGPANLAKLEKTLQNLAKYVRNSQVIKSFVVPYANIVANAVQLLILGVPPQDIIKGMRLKIKECNDYVKILNEVALLRATGLSREGTVSDNEAQAQKLLALTEQMSISPMIKAGEFNSITDDVITRDELDINNPSLGLFNKYSEKVSNMLKDHPNVRALLVDKDSDTYRFLAKATQYGDFIAKSIYYDHLKKTKVNENEALYRATTAFVNYDFMPSRGRDYFESLGLAWYFNYKLRMSKIMLHMMQFNPVRSMIYAYLPLKLWDVTLDTPFKDSSLGRFLGMGPSNMSSIGFDNFFKLKNYIPALNLLDVLHY